jgi:hypothetical protein
VAEKISQNLRHIMRSWYNEVRKSKNGCQNFGQSITLEIFENKFLTRICGPQRKEAIGNGKYKMVKGKAVPLHAMEALGGRGAIAPTHSGTRH